jgi:hypothetical protein
MLRQIYIQRDLDHFRDILEHDPEGRVAVLPRDERGTRLREHHVRTPEAAIIN